MSSGLAAPIPQIPGLDHDFLDPDSWPARQLETALARLQSVQAALHAIRFEGTKTLPAGSGTTQAERTARTWPRPLKITSTAKIDQYETDVTDALASVTTAITKLRATLNATG